MKSSLIIFFILIFAVSAFGQTKESVPTKPAKEPKARSEADEALTDFDLGKISINPNNLTRKNIEDLRANFPADVKPYLIDEGEYVARLARIAEPIFRFHKARKSRTVVFEHERPTVFTWKETFVTFSTGAMDLLTDDEVAALIAHEIGHLYFAEVLARARADKNDRAARVIELRCDLVALTTLAKLNFKPANLISALGKQIKRRGEFGSGNFEAGSPALDTRQEILKRFVSREKAKFRKTGGCLVPERE